jgi:hypothetical protein
MYSKGPITNIHEGFITGPKTEYENVNCREYAEKKAHERKREVQS